MNPSGRVQGSLPTGLWQQFARHSPRYGIGLLLLAAYQYLQYWFDTRLRDAINAAVAGQYQQATRLGALLVTSAVAAFAIRVLSRVAIFNAGRNAEYELRSALVEKLLTLGPSFYRHMSTGEIMSRATNDLGQLRLLLGFAVLNLINTLFALVSAFAVTLPISGKLTLIALSPLPAVLLITRGFAKQFYTRTRAQQDALGQLSTKVQSSIAGVRVVRAFGLEPQEISGFKQISQDYLEKSLGLARLRGSMGPILQAVLSLGILTVFWYGGTLILKGELDEGGFLAFTRALGRITWPLISMGFVLGLLQRGRAAYARLKDVYSAEPDVKDGSGLSTAVPHGKLEVRHLSFAYNAEPVLTDVSFTLTPGRSLAIVGRTGSGKSTLALLLTRLQPTPKNSVFLDGHDICDLSLAALRHTIGYAQQIPFLFSTTVAHNIGFSLEDPDNTTARERIRAAAHEACIYDEVMDLPDGFDTVVGERGVQLSGGQKQRTALAAAFVLEPKILILDDPISAVDARTERGILDAIDRKRRKHGLILITHRVAAAAQCDQILVLDSGKIVEQGTHEELCKTGGLYALFAEEQRIQSELEKLADPTSDLTETASP